MLSATDESTLKALASNGFRILVVDSKQSNSQPECFSCKSQKAFEKSYDVEFPKNLSQGSIFEFKNSHFIIADKESSDLLLCYMPETSAKTLALKPLNSKRILEEYNKNNIDDLTLAISDGHNFLYTNTPIFSQDPKIIDESEAAKAQNDKFVKAIIASAKAMLDSNVSKFHIEQETSQKLSCNNISVSMTPIKSQGAILSLIEISSTTHAKKCLQAENKLEKISSCLDSIAKKAYQNHDIFKFLAETQNELISICKFETIFTTIRKKDVPEKTVICGNEDSIDKDILSLSMQHCTAEEKPLYLDYVCNGKTFFCRVLPLWIKTGNIGEMVFISSAENKELLFEMDKLISTIRLMIELQIHKSSHIQNAMEIEKLRSFRSEIVETVNHDMKTPLTSIMGYAELLNMGLITEKEQIADVGKSLQNAGNQMLELIRELEKLSKKTLIVPKLSIKEIETETFIKDAAKLMMPIFESSCLEFRVNIQNGLPKIKGDLSKLYEIVLNLLSNASKYTESGGTVTLGAERMMNNYVKVYIQDTGIGIPPEKRRMIFNKYTRVNINKPGTGLGLYLSKVYAESMGGKLFVESEGENKGSTFYLMMPSI